MTAFAQLPTFPRVWHKRRMLQLLAILMQASSAPPVPPPPAESVAAAKLLWADHPPAEAMKQQAIEGAVAEATTRALYKIGVQPSPRLSMTKAYLIAYDRLKPLIARRVPANRSELDTAVAACAMDGVARTLSPAEITDVRHSLSSVAGQKFWNAAGLAQWSLAGCYRASLDLKPVDADYRAAGLRSPKPPKSPRNGTTIHY